MKKLARLLLIALICILSLGLAACDGGSNQTTTTAVHTHSYGEWEITKNPTCNTAGEKSRYCTCGETQTQVVASTGHAFGDWVVTTEPSCEENGVETKSCSCGETQTREIAAKGHAFGDWVVTTEPSCEEKGVETRECSCGETETRSIDATGHTFGEWAETKAPTCIEKGEETRTCHCGDSETRYVDAVGHTEVTDKAKAPTCTEIGLTEGKHCSVCNEVLAVQIAINSLGHTVVIDNAVEPTYTTTGLTQGSHCFVCGDILVAQMVIPMLSYTKATLMSNTLTVTDTTISGKVSNDTILFNFADDITLTHGAVWIVSTDIYGIYPIVSKTAPLEEGENILYIHVTNPDQTISTYTVNIYRNHLYTVSFNTNGGTSVATQYVEEGKIATQPFTERIGYKFSSWNFDFKTAIISNVTISASWIANEYTLSFDSVGGSLVEDKKINYDESFVLPEITKAGYTFEGWFIGDDKFVAGTWNYIENKTVTAKWTAIKYTIGYNLDGGIIDGKNPDSYTIEDKFTLINPTKKGYTFVGWTYEGVNEPVLDVTISDRTAPLNFVAHFDANEYTLSFESDNGNFVDDKKILYDEFFELPEISKNGYKFEGWFIGDDKFVAGTWNYVENKTVTAKWTAIKYTISYNLNGGTVDGTNPATYTVEDEFTLINPTKAGYTFLGWTYNDVTEPKLNVTISDRIENITFVANFKANTNTPYKVEYYFENSNKNGYDILNSETENLAGTTDTIASITPKTFEHFKFNSSKSTTSGNIDGDGTLVLKVYYDRNSYTVTTSFENAKGGSVTSGDTKIYGNEITVTATVKAGYTWLGWYEGNALVSGDLAYTFMPTRNISLVAKWSANEDTFYTVEYYHQNIDNNDYSLIHSDILTGTTDTLATATINSYPHFTYYAAISNASGNIDGEGDAVLKIYYTRSSYTVTTRAMNAKAGSVTSGSAYRYGKTITVTATTNPGYTFLGWYAGNTLVCETESYKFTVENAVTLTAKWSANTDTKYTVEYYLENKNQTGYTKVDTVVLEGTTDTTANAVISEYAYFTFTNTNSEISGNIAGNSTLVLKVYYTRDVYTINSAVENGKAGTVTSGGKYAYENSVSLVASSNPGYTFLGWYEGDTKVCDTLTFTFNAEKNVTYTAKWSADEDTPYVVKHYKQTDDRTGYELVDTQYLFGVTDTTAQVISKTFDGLNVNNVISKLSGNISGDGSLILEVYYWRGYYRDGEYIYFGEYPQTIKSDSVQITTYKDERGYYLGSDGCYYAKVVSIQYNSGYKFSNSETITTGETYYFKVEPIRWRLLSENGESAFILCDSIIDDHSYDEDKNNNYKDSDVRQWLNNEFYNEAFGEIQKELIQVTTVDNSAASTESSNNSYACENTEDKVFLLSYREAIKSDYDLASKTNRKMQTTDYARAVGASISTAESSYGYGDWWLRSPDENYKNSVMVVYDTGTVDDSGHSSISDGEGIVPAMWITL